MIKEAMQLFREQWQENPWEVIGSIVFILFLAFATWGGLWLIAIIEGRA